MAVGIRVEDHALVGLPIAVVIDEVTEFLCSGEHSRVVVVAIFVAGCDPVFIGIGLAALEELPIAVVVDTVTDLDGFGMNRLG